MKKIEHPPAVSIDQRIALIVNEGHDIHHIHERGYVEAPVRISSILKGIIPTGLFDTMPAHQFPDKHIKAVHRSDFVEYLKRMCQTLEIGKIALSLCLPDQKRDKAAKGNAGPGRLLLH